MLVELDRVFAICSYSIHRPFTLYSPSIGHVFAVYFLFAIFLFILCKFAMYLPICLLFALYSSCIQPVFSLYSPCIRPVFTLYSPCIPLYTPSIRRLIAAYSPSISLVFAVYLLMSSLCNDSGWHSPSSALEAEIYSSRTSFRMRLDNQSINHFIGKSINIH